MRKQENPIIKGLTYTALLLIGIAAGYILHYVYPIQSADAQLRKLEPVVITIEPTQITPQSHPIATQSHPIATPASIYVPSPPQVIIEQPSQASKPDQHFVYPSTATPQPPLNLYDVCQRIHEVEDKLFDDDTLPSERVDLRKEREGLVKQLEVANYLVWYANGLVSNPC